MRAPGSEVESLLVGAPALQGVRAPSKEDSTSAEYHYEEMNKYLQKRITEFEQERTAKRIAEERALRDAHEAKRVEKFLQSLKDHSQGDTIIRARMLELD